ncbi:MAG: excinuclease ABC subunit UvrA [bacterium]|nr:excinuclease ABC subunit UvrA [bacterium]
MTRRQLDTIRIRGARQNNLAGVDVDLPRRKLVAITGVSGSGKSSLAFDTLFREGQRRFLETLSAYARQFLGNLSKPDVESIEGLSPAIAVDQKSISRGSRSTVGTLTEVVDHLRVLYARAGIAYSPWCDRPVESRTPESVVQELLREYGGTKVQIAAPLVRDRKGQHRALLEQLRKKGFVRARIDGEVVRIEDAPELERYKRHSIEVVVDRLKPDPAQPSRLREAVEQALEVGDGDLMAITADGAHSFSTRGVCPETGREIPPLEPRLFSFNSPHGACDTCGGLGQLRAPSESAVVRDASLSIRDGALAVTRASGGALLFPRVDFSFLERVGKQHGFDIDTPWSSLTPTARRKILRGTGDDRYTDTFSWNGTRNQGSARWRRRFRGVLTELERAWERGSRRKMVERFLSVQSCPDCSGSRLNPVARAVRLGDVRLPELTSLPVEELWTRLDGLKLTARQGRIARDLLLEIRRRTEFLVRVGLGYLTLDRSADSLSGGEAQRIRLAAQLGAGLQGVLYVLDEPSIGLHACDHERLLGALGELRDAGNTVVVVEHDEATLRSADYVIDVGPGAGRHGGEIVAVGTPADIAKSEGPTARLLRGEIVLPAPESRRAGNGDRLCVRGATAFNLKGVDVEIPLGTFVAVSGVSGSGKSTLIERTLKRAVTRHLGREAPEPGAHDSIEGLEHVDELISIDATPIGRTPRSNPATYTKVFSPIRDLFAQLPESLVRGYTKSRFSFNVAGGGRCEACGGAGAILVELQFLAPVTVPCAECGGHRYQAETLDVTYRGHSIADVLAMTASEAHELFRDHPKIARPLGLMVEIGLGYLTLGQPSTTISGGEAQRLKLVTHLSKRPKGHTLYLLDEPTTGLHMEDVGRLLAALQKLVDLGHTVLVIEHNLDLIRAADHVFDLGPGGGEAGGTLVAAGTPEQIVANAGSVTGVALAGGKQAAKGKNKRPTKSAAADGAPQELVVEGATVHNLKSVDVSIPRDALTVITGPSGSGKSSLALDTIYTEGRRRFVESLSTYARQFLGTKDKPPYERIEGLGPAVAVEAQTVSGHPRSTVATTTEIHDHLRVLWARAGTARCPDHGETLVPTDVGGVTRRILKDVAEASSPASTSKVPTRAKGWILAPVFGHGMPAGGDVAAELERRAGTWTSAGFVRVLLDGAEVRIDELDQYELVDVEDVDLVIDRVSFKPDARARIAEAVEQAQAAAGGRISVLIKDGERREYSTHGACTQCGFQLAAPLEPRHFSFNTHVGACPTCDGLGTHVIADAELLVTHPDKALTDGAVGGKLGRYLTRGKGYYETLLRHVAAAHKVPIDKPFEKLSKRHRDLIMHGSGARASYQVALDKETRNTEVHESFTTDWTGLCGHVDAWHRKAEDPEWAGMLEAVMTRSVCPACEGERLAPGFRAVMLGRKRLPEILRMTVGDSLEWLTGLRLRAAVRDAVEPVVQELRSRISLLDRVGLGYLTLDRSTATLSGGEARRVRLSASLGSELVGVCYVLDEPTVGLHPADIERLTDALCDLRDRGNTVLVVEHDATLMRRADWLVDVGPGAGIHGGTIVASATPADVQRDGTSGTAAYLRGEIDLGRTLREDAESAREHVLPETTADVRLRGATTHNLKGVDLTVHFGELLGICGPSGSGKSTLLLDTLVPALHGDRPEGRWRTFQNPLGGILRTVVVDASPIGRTPHSVPATYTGLMAPLRELFARTPDARMRGYGISQFSFNGTKGRCPACDGRGAVLVEMQFLADLWLTCEECDGRRFQPEVLEVRFRGKSIADVLDMSVVEALEFLAHVPKAKEVLATLNDVGLGYMKLGQSSTTLSGGEAQRVKLAAELQRANERSRSIIVLDEPSTGLAATDVVHLARSLGRLARRGNAVVLIEHHTELLGVCQRLIELGPAGGAAGGKIIATGTPAELAADKGSITGPWLQLEGGAGSPGGKGARGARSKASKGKKTKRVTGGVG